MELSFTEKKSIRKNFGKLKEILSIPNLIDVQKKSYKQFLTSKDQLHLGLHYIQAPDTHVAFCLSFFGAPLWLAQTNTFVQAIEHLPAKIVDTRKTLPGLRMIQKYAVRVGGGINHRINLADGILIKDNHIKILAREKLDLESIVNKARQHARHPLKIEVEVESISQVKDAIRAGADILLLDNMSIKDMTEAVTIIDG